MYQEFFDKGQDKEFKEWLRKFPHGFYLNKRRGSEMMLHKVGCSNLGDGEEMNSTTNPKVAADNTAELFN